MPDSTRDVNDPDRSELTSAAGSPGLPRWVKVFGIIAAVVIAVLLLVMVLVGGEHGPGRHMSFAAGERVAHAADAPADVALADVRG